MKSIAGNSVLTDPDPVSLALCHEQVEKIVSSRIFQSAPTLQQLFRFLASRAGEAHSEEIKEYTIGIEALGRKQDFDPKTDPIVRVQVYRLRQKLKEYYQMEGSQDSILVDIPKGHYLPRFEALPHQPVVPQHLPVSQLAPLATNTESISPRTLPHKPVLLILLGLAVFAAGFWTARLRSQHDVYALHPDKDLASPGDPVKAFWATFVKEDPAPIIAYADAYFLLDGSTDLFRYRHGASDDRGARVDPHLAREFASNPELVARAGPLYFDNGYTGTGDVAGVAMLVSLFTQMGAKPTVESSFDLTTHDLTQHNVVLLGSSFQNVAVAQLPAKGDFVYVGSNSRHDLWSGRIVDTHPQQNSEKEYGTVRDPATGALKADYALVTFEPGVVPGRHIVNLGGLDTKGMEGAVLFATSKSGIEALSKALPVSEQVNLKDKVPSFQALLRVDLEKGYQVLDTQFLAVRPLKASTSQPVSPEVPPPAAQ